MSDEPASLVRAARIAATPAFAFRHPLNPNSEVHLRSPSDLAGLRRTAFHVGRIPPGKESFIYHSHRHQEEWVYVLEGRGIAEIDDREYEVGPGDFMGFTAPGVAHHLRNPSASDLVYLMGGERGDFEIGEFPRHGKRGIFSHRESLIVAVKDAVPFFPGSASNPEKK